MLGGERESAKRSRRYKLIDRSELAHAIGRAYEPERTLVRILPDNKKALENSRTLRNWRARQDSNLQPSDP